MGVAETTGGVAAEGLDGGTEMAGGGAAVRFRPTADDMVRGSHLKRTAT